MPNSAYYKVESFDNNIYEQPPTTRTNPVRRVQLKWWFWELFAASISLALFGAVIVVLKVFDGHALPQLPLGITLNTTVSLIAAVSKTALLLVASATMSQLKWLWVHKSSRKLRDLQAFDEASRGPWGSVTLLQHSRLSVASLAALITLLLLGFDPFIQQLITTPQRDVSFEAASTAVLKASTFDRSIQLSAYNDVDNALLRLSGANPEVTIQMAVSNGASSQGVINDFTPSCPTSNCTWPSFQSLGLCSTCVDVTNYAQEKWSCEDSASFLFYGATGVNRTCSYNLPNSAFDYEYQIFHSDTYGNYTEVDGELRLNVWTTNVQHTTFSDNILMLVSHVAFQNTGALVPGIGREQVVQASECALAMCVQEHSLSVVSGVMHHSIESVDQPFSMEIVEETPYYTSYDIKEATINNVKYTVDGTATIPLVLQSINETLPGNITADYTTNQTANEPVRNDGGIISSTDLVTSFFAGLNFTQAVDNMAISVSTYIRSLSNDTTTGRAHNEETYIHVRWIWLAFPVVLLAGGIAILVIAMIQTSQSGLEVWKSSSLPLWFHGPPNGRTNSFGNSLERVNTLMEMEAEAEQIHVSLEKLDDGTGAWKLLPIQNNVKSGYI
jgi:Protein of unknown function (DUF3176)